MSIDDVYKFINSLTEEDFYEYLTPASYYNTSLLHSICSDSIPKISNKNLLEIYFLLSENEEDILEVVYQKMLEHENDDDDLELNGLNWYVIIFYLMKWNFKELYRNLFVGKTDKEKLNLIELNRSFDRKRYFIFNDTDTRESFWTESLTDCILLAANRDKEMNLEKIITDQKFVSNNISFSKGEFILFTDFKELETLTGEFFDPIKSEIVSIEREIKLSKILSERKVYTFSGFVELKY